MTGRTWLALILRCHFGLELPLSSDSWPGVDSGNGLPQGLGERPATTSLVNLVKIVSAKKIIKK